MPPATWDAAGAVVCKNSSACTIVTATACYLSDDTTPDQLDDLPDTELGRDTNFTATAAAPPAAAAAAPAVPSPEAFGSDNDVILRAPSNSCQVAAPILSQQHQTLPYNQLNQAVDFETPLFKGQLLVLFRGLPNIPSEIFAGKRRLMWLAVQGQFKQPVPFDSLMVGSEFTRPLKLPASAFLIRASQWLINKLGSGVQVIPVGDRPHILAPLVSAAQIINVSLPGHQPDLLAAEEDMTLYDNSLVSGWAGAAMSASKRRSYLATRSHRQGKFYDTEHVWTFHLYDQSLDYSTFTLPIPLLKLDLVQVLDGQPLQLMMKDVSSGCEIMRFEVWHKRMLEHKANSMDNQA